MRRRRVGLGERGGAFEDISRGYQLPWPDHGFMLGSRRGGVGRAAPAGAHREQGETMAVALYLQVVDDPDAGWLGEISVARPRATGWDAQLLPDAPAHRGRDRVAPRVFIGELSDRPRDRQAEKAGGAALLPARIETLVGNAARTIDEGLVEGIVLAFDASGAPDDRIGSPVEVWRFLRAHEGARVRTVRQPNVERTDLPGTVKPDAAAPIDSASPVERVVCSDIAPVASGAPAASCPSADLSPPTDFPPSTDLSPPTEAPSPVDAPDVGGGARWGVLADWLTLATLRAVVVAVVALHLVVLIGEAFVATP